MPISILANITIELFATMSWWIIKNTFTGIYYLVFRNNKKTTYIQISREEYDSLIKKNLIQEHEIKKLQEQIEIKENYFS